MHMGCPLVVLIVVEKFERLKQRRGHWRAKRDHTFGRAHDDKIDASAGCW
jgi:hypothetical protein